MFLANLLLEILACLHSLHIYTDSYCGSHNYMIFLKERRYTVFTFN
jgi:L-rhamnose mutarotase